MFLATTALSEFWDKQQEILFLGYWCLRDDRRPDWEGLKYQVLPSLWDDRRRFYDSARYLDECGERMLNRLSSYLNESHGVSHSQRYWRILIGTWLFHYLHSIYDRYIHLQEATKLVSRMQTVILDSESFMTPISTDDGIHWLGQDLYNLQLYSQLWQLMGFSVSSRRAALTGQNFCNVRKRLRWRDTAHNLLRVGARYAERAAQYLRGGCPAIALCDMSMPLGMLWRLALQSRLHAVPFKFACDFDLAAFGVVGDRQRRGLATLPASSEFERVFIETLPQNFPVLYLEGYARARNATLANHSRFPQAIVSETGWAFNEPFKFFAAEASERAVRLIAVQHGGGYGLSRHTPYELHEARIADSYLVWGWAEDEGQSKSNWPNPKLSALAARAARRKDPCKAETVLFVATADLPYLTRFYHRPVGSQWENYSVWQQRFFLALSNQSRSVTRFRHQTGRWGLEEFGKLFLERIRQRFPEVQPDDGAAFFEKIWSSRIIVFDNQGTGFLETLAANVPTILFWNPQEWEVGMEAEPHVQRLREAGILWDSPETAAEKVARIYDDPWAWWGSDEVQEARRRFVERYALGRADWADTWVQGLNGLCSNRSTSAV